MSLARAFTARRNKSQERTASPFVGRAASQRSPNPKPISRADISLPVELISTTNMLSYEAPDIVTDLHREHSGLRNVSLSASVSSGTLPSDDESSRSERSDRSSSSARSHHTDATSVDGLSTSPELNHLSCYFKKNAAYETGYSRHNSSASAASWNSPTIPQRAPTHSKQAHVLSHKLSVQRNNSSTSTRYTTSSTGSFDMYTSSCNATAAPATHPFGKELEQLNEAAEEFGYAVRDAEAEADQTILNAKNLARFCAADYMQEISGLHTGTMAKDTARYQALAWI